MKKRTSIFILMILFIILVILIIQISPYFEKSFEVIKNIDTNLGNVLLEKEETKVVRIVDGDTIELENKDKVRLLGINTPEKGEIYYQEAKLFLESNILNKTVVLEKGKENTDLYGRKLRYIYLENRNINQEIVLNGLANVYYPTEKDWHTEQMMSSWNNCVNNNIFLCEKSINKCSLCIKLEKFDHENELIILKNTCSFSCNIKKWKIKDEGRKKFVFPEISLNGNEEITIKVGEGTNTNEVLFWKNQDYVWTETGDTLFLRDSDDKLVLWSHY